MSLSFSLNITKLFDDFCLWVFVRRQILMFIIGLKLLLKCAYPCVLLVLVKSTKYFFTQETDICVHTSYTSALYFWNVQFGCSRKLCDFYFLCFIILQDDLLTFVNKKKQKQTDTQGSRRLVRVWLKWSCFRINVRGIGDHQRRITD